MFRLACLISLVLLVSLTVNADEPRHQSSFSSGNSKYEARLVDRQWKLIEKSTGREHYQFSDYYGRGIWFSSMTLVISDDGKSIVVLDDYSEQDFEKNPEVLFFFRDGKKQKGYRLLDLSSPKYLQVSVSHFRWFYSHNAISILNSQMDLTTLEMNRLVFSTDTGELLKKERDEALANGAVFVYGTVRALGRNQYEIIVDCTIYGTVKKGARINFESKKIGWVSGGHNEALIIQNGKLVAKKGIIFNTCHG
jgi:hypothetical protein